MIFAVAVRPVSYTHLDVYKRQVKDKFRLDLDNMVYAFDSSTISLCLKLCPWAKSVSYTHLMCIRDRSYVDGNLLTSAHSYDASALQGGKEFCLKAIG